MAPPVKCEIGTFPFELALKASFIRERLLFDVRNGAGIFLLASAFSQSTFRESELMCDGISLTNFFCREIFLCEKIGVSHIFSTFFVRSEKSSDF